MIISKFDFKKSNLEEESLDSRFHPQIVGANFVFARWVSHAKSCFLC